MRLWPRSAVVLSIRSILQGKRRPTKRFASIDIQSFYAPTFYASTHGKSASVRKSYHNSLIAVRTSPLPKSDSKNYTMAKSGGSKPVLFFDIDNCLYPRSTKVYEKMAYLIDVYFSKHLELPWDEAVRLHKEYFTNYGLAIEGLVRHHAIDPMEYNAKVDDALPLEGIIKPAPELRSLLEDMDRDRVRPWLLTNAYVNHARRVVRLLGVDDLFDGLTYCDYGALPFVCKPSKAMYQKAMTEAGVENTEDCYFVDDSFANCQKAMEHGWTAAHLVEEGLTVPSTQASQHQIRHLSELRDTFPQFFKSKNRKIKE